MGQCSCFFLKAGALGGGDVEDPLRGAGTMNEPYLRYPLVICRVCSSP